MEKNAGSFRLWSGKKTRVRALTIRFFSLFYEQDEFYCSPVELNARENGGVAVVRGHRVVKLDVAQKHAILDNGMTVSYEKCLIATGLYLFLNHTTFYACNDRDNDNLFSDIS